MLSAISSANQDSRLTLQPYSGLIGFLYTWKFIVMAKPTKELEILKQHLSKNGLKLTRQRENILTTFLKMEHVTAEQMYRLLSRKDPHIGLATVYRTLKLLCDTGLAQEQHFGSQTQFDNVAHKGHHDHLICTVCDKIIEFENCQIEELQEEVARKNGFTIRTHKLELYGTPMQLPNGDCKNCGRDLEALTRVRPR